MVVVVEVHLNAESYFPGDTVFCKITFSSKRDLTNREATNGNSSTSHHEADFEQVNWTSIQIGGHYVIEKSWVKLNPGAVNTLANHTSSPLIPTKLQPNIASSLKQSQSFNNGLQSTNAASNIPEFTAENSQVIFCTPATIVACDLKVAYGENKSYFFQATLPFNLPPSLKATGVKYRYLVVLSAQKTVNTPPKYFSFPFRVLNPASAIKSPLFIHGYPGFNYNIACSEISDTQDDFVSFSDKQSLSAPIKHGIVHHLQLLHEHDSNHTFNAVNALCEENSHPISININERDRHLVKFSLNKTVFQLGETVKGHFDFSKADLPCYQVSVRLETQEIIVPSIANPKRGNKPACKTIAEHHELTFQSKATSFLFHIPVEATQELVTDLLSVRWFLQFEFIKGTAAPGNCELLHWSFPIRVLVAELPPEPIYKTRNHMLLTNQ